MTRRSLLAGLVLLDLLVVAAPLRAFLRLPVAPMDEGLVLVYPERLLSGAVPNLDFESVYGVTWIWTMAAAFATAGHHLLVERLVGVGYRVVLMLAVYLVLRRQGRGSALVAAGLSGAVSFMALGAIATPVYGATALGLLAIAAADAAGVRDAPLLAGAAGVAAGLSLGFRTDLALPLAVGLAVVCRGWRGARIRPALLGLVLALVPVWVNLLRAGPVRVLRGELHEPLLVSSGGRRLPLSGLDPAVLVAAVALALLALVCLALSRERSFSGLAAFSLALTPYLASRADRAHVAWVVMVSIALIPMALRAAFATRGRVPLRLAAGILAVGALAAAVPAFLAPYGDLVGGSLSPKAAYPVVSEGRRTLMASRSDQVALQALLADVERYGEGTRRRLAVLPGDPSTAFYNDTHLYFLLPRFVPSTYYLEINPGVANGTRSRLADDLARTDLVVLNPRYDSGTRGSTRASAVLRAQFVPVSQHGPWRLLVRR